MTNLSLSQRIGRMHMIAEELSKFPALFALSTVTIVRDVRRRFRCGSYEAREAVVRARRIIEGRPVL